MLEMKIIKGCVYVCVIDIVKEHMCVIYIQLLMLKHILSITFPSIFAKQEQVPVIVCIYICIRRLYVYIFI